MSKKPANRRVPDKKPQEAPKQQQQSFDPELQYKSKERTIQIQQDISTGFDKSVDLQLCARDAHIEELNQKVQQLQLLVKEREAVAAKNKHKDEQISQLQGEIEQRNQEINTRIEQYNKLYEDFKQKQLEWEDEKEAQELISSELTEQQEAMRAKYELKVKEVGEIKTDIIQLSHIVQQLTALNKDLNGKIDGMNLEMAQLNAKCYEAEARANNTEELEAQLKTSFEQAKTFEKKCIKLNKLLFRVNESKNKLEETSREVQQQLMETFTGLGAVSDDIGQMHNTNFEDRKKFVLQQVAEFAKQVRNVRQSLKAVTPIEKTVILDIEAIPEESDLQIRVTVLEQLSKQQEQDVQNYIIKCDKLENQAKKLRQALDNQLKESEEGIERANKRANAYIEQNEKFKERIEKMRELLEEKDVNLQKTQTKLITLQQHLQSSKKRAAEMKKERDALAQKTKDFREFIMKMKADRLAVEQDIKAREANMKKQQIRFGVLHDAIFMKDTEVLRKVQIVKKQESEINDLKNQLSTAIERTESQIELSVLKYKKIITDKEHEIKILREMVQSTKTQVSQKDGDIVRFKKKLERMSPEPSFIRKGLDVMKEKRRGANNISIVEDPRYTNIAAFLQKIQKAQVESQERQKKAQTSPSRIAVKAAAEQQRSKKEALLDEFREELPDQAYSTSQINQTCRNNRLKVLLPAKNRISRDELLESLRQYIFDQNQ